MILQSTRHIHKYIYTTAFIFYKRDYYNGYSSIIGSWSLQLYFLKTLNYVQKIILFNFNVKICFMVNKFTKHFIYLKKS